MRKHLKIILIFALFFILIINNICIASPFDTNIKINNNNNVISNNKETIQKALGVTQVIGTIISVIALVIIGIKYMLSSVEEQANMKGILIYYVIGAVLVFATTNVLGIAYTLISNI